MYAEQDKKRKEDIDVRNQAESMVYETEKTLDEVKDKVDANTLAGVNAAKDALNQALQGTDTADIKAKTENLTNEFQKVSQILYQNAQAAGAQGAAGAGAGGFDPTGGAANSSAGASAGTGSSSNNDDVVDADFEVVDDDK